MSTATHTRHRLIRLPRKLIIEALALTAFVVPVYLFIKAGSTSIPGRNSVPAVADVPNIPIANYHDAVPVLIYHDIADRPGHFVVTPQHFADQMAALHAQGFHSITVKQLLAFYHGGSLPNKPIMLTFDDGLGDFWRTADPIMQRYGFHGVVFVISGQIGKHGFYYMRPQELRDIVQSGRWDVEAHTHMLHNYIPISLNQWGPALANRLWMPRLGRVETIPEYVARISNDLDLNVGELRQYGANPQVFAYPFSATGVPSNDRRHLVSLLTRMVAHRFLISFVDNAGQRFITRYDATHPQLLPRLEVYHDTTAARLMGRLKVLVPIPPRVKGIPATGWYDEATNRGLQGLVHNGALVPSAPHHRWFATYWLPSTTQLWRNYETSVTVNRLGSPKSGVAGTLLVGVAGFHGYSVTLSANRIAVRSQVGGHLLWYGDLLRTATTHRLTVRLGNRLEVWVDAHKLRTIRVRSAKIHGGIGFGTWVPGHHPAPTFTALRISMFKH